MACMERLHAIAARVVAGLHRKSDGPRVPLTGCVPVLARTVARCRAPESRRDEMGARDGQGEETIPRCAAVARREETAGSRSAFGVKETVGAPADRAGRDIQAPLPARRAPSEMVCGDHGDQAT